MWNLYRMEDKDWVRKWAQVAESLINLMPAYQMNPDQFGPIVRNTADGRKQLLHARWGLPSPFFVIKEAAEARAKKLRVKGMEGAQRFRISKNAMTSSSAMLAKRTTRSPWPMRRFSILPDMRPRNCFGETAAFCQARPHREEQGSQKSVASSSRPRPVKTRSTVYTSLGHRSPDDCPGYSRL